eukprot:scaffold19923_cov107-Isochrysis_galbana.AAC.4
MGKEWETGGGASDSDRTAKGQRLWRGRSARRQRASTLAAQLSSNWQRSLGGPLLLSISLVAGYIQTVYWHHTTTTAVPYPYHRPHAHHSRRALAALLVPKGLGHLERGLLPAPVAASPHVVLHATLLARSPVFSARILAHEDALRASRCTRRERRRGRRVRWRLLRLDRGARSSPVLDAGQTRRRPQQPGDVSRAQPLRDGGCRAPALHFGPPVQARRPGQEEGRHALLAKVSHGLAERIHVRSRVVPPVATLRGTEYTGAHVVRVLVPDAALG